METRMKGYLSALAAAAMCAAFAAQPPAVPASAASGTQGRHGVLDAKAWAGPSVKPKRDPDLAGCARARAAAIPASGTPREMAEARRFGGKSARECSAGD